jgi:hypothetical protein
VYTAVKLWEVPYERILQTNDYPIWALAGLMAGATVDTTIAVAERLAAAPIPREDQIEFTNALLLLSGLRLPGRAILEALRRSSMLDDILRESSFADALREYLHDQWKEEGVEQGRMEATRQAARVALEGRFGALSADLLAALNAANEQVLMEIIASVTTETLQQVRQRLGLPPE